MDNKNTYQKMREFILSPVGKWGIIGALYVVILLIVGALIGILQGIGAVIALAIFGYFGFKALNRITPDIFLIMPIGGWVLYFVFKLVLSLIVGIFVTPFVISKYITAYIQRKVEEEDGNGE